MCAALAREQIAGEVVVVDDSGCGAAREAFEQVASAFTGARMRLVHAPHGGRSAARNRGVAESGGEILLFLDDDVLVMPGTLASHVRAHRKREHLLVRGTIVQMPRLAVLEDPQLGVWSERSRAAFVAEPRARQVVELLADGSPAPSVRKLGRLARFERDVHQLLASGEGRRAWPGATGAQLSMRRADFTALGGFDENMGRGWGAEDLEFGYRAERAGLRIYHERASVVYHMDDGRRGREAEHAAALAYFAAKHRDPSVLLLERYFAGRCALEDVVA
jgi:GT2 family glycosyltransferase